MTLKNLFDKIVKGNFWKKVTVVLQGEFGMNHARRILPSVLALLSCFLLFSSWGDTQLGGEIYLREGYSNPITVKGTYLRGVAQSVEQLSQELNGFQEQAELAGLCIMTVLIFLTVLELIYAVIGVFQLDMSRSLGIVTEILVLAVMVLAVGLGILEPTISFADGGFRIITKVQLNAVPFLIIVFEILGKNVFAKKID